MHDCKCVVGTGRGNDQRVDLQADLLHYDHLQSTAAKCQWMHSKWQKSWRMGDAVSEWDSYCCMAVHGGIIEMQECNKNGKCRTYQQLTMSWYIGLGVPGGGG